ncbi:MAG: MlaD family protein [Thiolinea sp.]
MEAVEPEPDSGLAADLPAVRVRRQRWPSPVWLIPLAAALVGVWLLFQYWFQQGTTITVRFPSAEGIEPGSTQVRFKAVTVGKVKNVTLDENLNPLVTLALNKDISNELACSAQFWVVRPRVRGAEISGISTLFSGTYVGMVPAREEQAGTESKSLLCYEVLDEAPVSKPTRPGREVVLMTDSMGSLDVGTPVFYKQLQVGEIYNYRLSSASGKIELGVFIDDPYYRFVNANTRFWNVSGMDFKMDSTGAEFRMESLSSLLVGGIAFDTPREQAGGNGLPVVEPGAVFELFADYRASREKRYEDRLYYTLYFNGSLRGLAENAPVEFQGIRVGQVEKSRCTWMPSRWICVFRC